ncbi:PREDICTED: wiskott-Aldrich syndrome protein homolog 1-like [Haliaeetus leucocephalus]|uniref:wiskott-Aldrich syndrome protein homolog 1-like n=1 Tax=Haliaeetus leucocephalus TaxID=52644 RepID=UPI00053CBF50|nr:PREDICTED: wiskott-Aldrich syndrome protein homolog 1-like [Haliaeetus leucocephalus]
MQLAVIADSCSTLCPPGPPWLSPQRFSIGSWSQPVPSRGVILAQTQDLVKPIPKGPTESPVTRKLEKHVDSFSTVRDTLRGHQDTVCIPYKLLKIRVLPRGALRAPINATLRPDRENTKASPNPLEADRSHQRQAARKAERSHAENPSGPETRQALGGGGTRAAGQPLAPTAASPGLEPPTAPSAPSRRGRYATAPRPCGELRSLSRGGDVPPASHTHTHTPAAASHPRSGSGIPPPPRLAGPRDAKRDRKRKGPRLREKPPPPERREGGATKARDPTAQTSAAAEPLEGTVPAPPGVISSPPRCACVGRGPTALSPRWEASRPPEKATPNASIAPESSRCPWREPGFPARSAERDTSFPTVTASQKAQIQKFKGNPVPALPCNDQPVPSTARRANVPEVAGDGGGASLAGNLQPKGDTGAPLLICTPNTPEQSLEHVTLWKRRLPCMSWAVGCYGLNPNHTPR